MGKKDPVRGVRGMRGVRGGEGDEVGEGQDAISGRGLVQDHFSVFPSQYLCRLVDVCLAFTVKIPCALFEK